MMYFVLKTGVYEWKGMETIMYKCCIFDLDGTLVNSIHAIQRSVDLSLEKWGMRKITVDECRVFVAMDISCWSAPWRPAGTAALYIMRRQWPCIRRYSKDAVCTA